MEDQTIRKHLVFVYGTLLSGLGNHHIIEPGHFIADGETVERFRMTAGGIPFVSRVDPVCRVKGELYIVNDETLADLDRLEGHPRFYCRELVEVEGPGGAIFTAWCYLCERGAGHHLVDDGDFRRVANAWGMGV
jgi:gamma-glutamylaminecyclotransferase